MSREHLRDAADALDRAADGVADTDRARTLADSLRSLAERDTGPDHGRLARIENALVELRDGADDEAAAALDETKEHVEAYRENVPGV
ncbi:DUF7553 family protein [Halosegnis marinus]|uniref:Uncharacterized protein n=2 Tax=Halosegnis marinus TaxID=3034023 RepID=A0ABD5ZLA2_9EURY|nr:hypothetical protein [Halosegnis sp. DT85]